MLGKPRFGVFDDERMSLYRVVYDFFGSGDTNDR